MEKSKSRKSIMIIAAVIVLLLAITAFVVIFIKKKPDSYRLLKVFEVEGKANVKRDGIGDIEPYQNMVLESGDDVSLETGKMTIKADEDKFLYLEEQTEIVLNANGSSDKGKINIELKKGAITNDIQKKLSDDSSYEINTPNSTMSVRGTVYYVSTYIGADGKRYTKVSVFDGTVETDLVDGGGIKAGGNRMVSKGNEVIIFADDDDTDYYADLREIKYEDIPAEVLDILQEINESKYRFEIPENITDDKDQGEKDGPFTVTFKYKDKVFGTQKVEWGHKATEPSLKPAETGSWNFDFNSLIKDDTEIIWE
jgi:hypothetical protein